MKAEAVAAMVLGGVLFLVSSVDIAIRWWKRRFRGIEPGLLFPTFLYAFGALSLVFGWLRLTESTTSRGEALKTAGLVSGAIVALYALWLNDRRRRTEEDRREIEKKRISDERLEHTIDLLGNDADQVRVGAMHSLARQAVDDSDYMQIALDLLCAYLRRPFGHPELLDVDISAIWEKDVVERIASERHVRSVAQRLIRKMLYEMEDWDQDEHATYELDLSGAVLESFSLEACLLKTIDFTDAHFVGESDFRWVHAVSWEASNATFHGPLFMNVCTIKSANFSQATFCKSSSVTGTEFTRLAILGVKIRERLTLGDVPIVQSIWGNLDPSSKPLELVRIAHGLVKKIGPEGVVVEVDHENETAIIRPSPTA